MYILRLDFPLFFTQICVFYVHQDAPSFENLFASNSKLEEKFFSYDRTCCNLFTSDTDYLNILLPNDCSVMPHCSSAALFYQELCSIFEKKTLWPPIFSLAFPCKYALGIFKGVLGRTYFGV